ncbi:MAG: DinB family protein [Gammaproteobacteria bacterium]
MESSLQTVSHLYRATDNMVEELLTHLNDEALCHTVDGNGNSALRLYAHLCVLRHRILNSITGSCDPIPFEGSAGGFPTEGDKLPRRGEVDVAYRAVTKKLYDCFEKLTAKQLAGKGPGQDDFLTEDKSLLGALTFLGYHEGYTVGQMGFLGHIKGKLPFVGHLG